MVDIKKDARNYRRHSDRNKELINKSISELGAGRSILIDNENEIIAGNGVFEQAKNLNIPIKVIETDGTELIALKRVDLQTKDEKRQQLAVMDNSTSDSSEFDLELLQEDFEIDALQDMGVDTNMLDQSSAESEMLIEDEVPEAQEKETSKLGDLWLLGNHRLLCGDSTKIEDVERLMNGEKADMVFTDPPYNVDYSNAGRPKPGKTNLGKIKNDKMEDAVFYQFLKDVYLNLDFYTKDNSSFYIWYASKETLNFISALNETKIEFNQEIIWKKPMLLGRSKYQWAHEPCIFGIKGSPYFTDDRTKTTVWDFGGYDKSKNVHPTQKPLFLPSEALKNSSRQENIILDIFGGSGSTLIACEQLNRKCFMMEIDPKYCDVIIRRWQKLTGQQAILESSGKSFDMLMQ